MSLVYPEPIPRLSMLLAGLEAAEYPGFHLEKWKQIKKIYLPDL
jgi:hypothetical protein